ncbi:hypothetical protein [Mangrovimonas aestuarii]|uniref:hypothetical protein n=1 Tax=Mangrovimonas aestuarii TaxID=3018443 RepID=UPI002379C121|nr:hypothetical protein [Mangrovimonas aestuarii]
MKTYFKHMLSLGALLWCPFIFSQVGIGTTSPDASSILDIQSDSTGILIPRMALSFLDQSTPVTDPANGLLVYNTVNNTELNEGFYFWKDNQWNALGETSNEDPRPYGEVSFDEDETLTLDQYTDVLLPIPAEGYYSSTVNLITIGSNYGIQPTETGVYKVTFTITYTKNSNSGPGQVEFYLSKNTNKITGTQVKGKLEHNELSSVHVSKIIQLEANQTYYLGASKTNTTPSGGPDLILYSNMTNLTIEKMN